jgi:hypothetical protein
MANGAYCLRIQGLTTAATIRFGPDIRDQNTGSTLSAMYMRLYQLPLKLQ